MAGGGGCDMVTVSPVLEAGGIQVAPVGLTDMLNAGGAVLSCSLTGMQGLSYAFIGGACTEGKQKRAV